MSASPNEPLDDALDSHSVDELAEANNTADDGEPGSSSAPPAKRGRGRPKGSKNKKTLAAGVDTTSAPTVPKKRGRPPKEKKADDDEPVAKRPRGRPPKNPRPSTGEAAASGEGGEPAPKKKRGRPPKKTTAA
ncbi:hypothetical protein CPB83DRAFT_847540 [Crepidotus variabilis]|uniref:Uncharacterized protein n=1 Tax=Crepidotus variabilis TaxID=179855 RepID=A0A9P6JSR7_9AGAR|nr:hypothetical protein CPB83DRAFT_847540 [Crepidotus variabilis]